MTAEPAIDGLDPEQAQAVLAPHGPVCILAGAGTGKTRTITHRIARLVHTGAVKPQQVLAVTFTARAAGEMRTRLMGLGTKGVQARTFHSAALRQLRYFWPSHFGGQLPELISSKFRLVGRAAARCKLSTDTAMVRDLAGEVEWSRSCLIDPSDYPAAVARSGRETPVAPETVVKVLETYEKLKQSAEVIDFEDMIMSMAFMIESVPQIAHQVRETYRSFVIDEYQDVNPLQQRLLDAWLGARDTVCVVGDANQTIYTFTGARPDYLLGFANRFPDASVVRLHRDYRSTPQVVTLANRVLDGSSGGLAGARMSLVGQQPTGPEPTITTYDDEPAEAAAVAAKCASLISSGTPAAQIAVLFRINAQSEIYEAALSSAGVPYILRGGEKFFERAEVREAVVFLRAAARTSDSTGRLGRAVRGVLANSGWDPEAAPSGGSARERWESLSALAGLADDLQSADPDIDLAAFVVELEQRAASQHAPTVQGVTLASLHAAKGLEWDAVFLVGLNDGMVPLNRARTNEQVEEERRLLYVGVTRARRILNLSWSLARSPGGRASRKQSRFLDALASSRGPTAKVAPSARRQKIARCKGCGQRLDPREVAAGSCGACLKVGDRTFERLRAWRMTVARSEEIAPYMVFDDETLGAISLMKPTTLSRLLKVKGVGEVKLGKYGSDLLEEIEASKKNLQKTQ
ncbi:Rep family ATP-dependent DNA helicase [Antricoccus suffuscus]|uniref:DNA 3'-5' helicase n=1 Tax=Antricoccus suffuscus TaxID=1629062 RepID=A0A2T0ZQF0_9ACTN|nr:ATP-dependent DNA helicase UvrD2 [Antricoccus suffuscus]PRZ38545.1 Rep family ATP-dependent DNA helicase [Antricoccus suffuscus]